MYKSNFVHTWLEPEIFKNVGLGQVPIEMGLVKIDRTSGWSNWALEYLALVSLLLQILFFFFFF